MTRRAPRTVAIGALVLLAAACADPRALKPEIRLSTQNYEFRIS